MFAQRNLEIYKNAGKEYGKDYVNLGYCGRREKCSRCVK